MPNFSRKCFQSVDGNGLLTFPHRDYKKLTFYYYADEYINFNDLVTDLFKVYKTRIWMSAINPASFPLIAAPQRLPLGSPATPTAMIGSGRGGAVVPYRHQMHPGRDRPWSRLQTQGRGASVANVHANLQPQMPGVQHHNIQSLQGMQAPTPQNQSLQFGAMGTMAGMGGVPSQVASGEHIYFDFHFYIVQLTFYLQRFLTTVWGILVNKHKLQACSIPLQHSVQPRASNSDQLRTLSNARK